MKQKNHYLKLTLAVLIVIVSLLAVPIGSFMGFELPVLFETKASAAFNGCYTYTVSDGNATITHCDTSIRGNVVIPDTLGGYPVTSIGSHAFYKCTGLTSITIPDSVTSIGNYAFENCTDLTSITIPDSVTSIGSSAFYKCTGLTSVYITDLAAWCKISFGAPSANPLYYAKKLYINGDLATNITIPDGVESIGSYVFRGYTSLTSVTIPDSVTSINGSAFYNCKGLKNITIGKNVNSIGESAFFGCTGLTKINWNAESVSDFTHNSNVFYNAGTAGDGIDVVFGDNVKRIPAYAFYVDDSSFRPNIKFVTVGNSVTSIGWNAFYGCTGLTSVYITDLAAWCNISFGSSYVNPLYYAKKLYINGDLATNITIPDGVESIGDFAFEDCTGLTSITIPDGVTSIGDYAFEDCTGLTNITIPDSVTSIGRSAFGNCTGLTKINWNAESVSDFDYSGVFYNAGTSGDGIDVVFGDNVKSIPAYAFYGSSQPNIKSVTIGNSVTSIGASAFFDCTGLTSVTIPDSVTSIDSSAFYNCKGLKNITIGKNVNSIGESAFFGCTGLTKINWNAENVSDFSSNRNVFYNAGTAGDGIDVVFGDNVKRIPAYTFHVSFSSYRPKINSVTIGNRVKSIGSSAFSNCILLARVYITDLAAWCKISFGDPSANPLYYAKKLYINGNLATNITIPDSVERIGSYALAYCTGLTSITIPDSVTSIGSSAFLNCPLEYVKMGNGLNYIPKDLIKNTLREFVIGNSVTSIGSYAFRDCTGLTSVTIPDSVTSIDHSAFNGCTGLTSVYITDLATWCKISFGAPSANPLYYAKKLYINGDLATNITIPDGVESIGSYAFRGYTSLTSVTISDSVTSINGSAFYNCKGLKNITIGKNVNSIGESAFFGCTGLTKINWNAENVSDFSSNRNVFYNAGTAGDGIDVVFGDNVKRIPAYAFDVSDSSYRPKIKSVTIGNRVKRIGSSAFNGCTGLTSITIPDSVISIGDYAFAYCTGLTSITIPDSVTSIGSHAFSGCTGLTSITIPDSVTSIGSHAFSGCTGLASITIPDSVTSIGSYAFSGCTGLTKFNWNAASVSDFDSDSNVFYNAGKYGDGIDVVFGDNVKNIPARTFYVYNSSYRPKIKSVTIGNSVTSIGGSAFEDCTGLTSVTIPGSVTSIDGYVFDGCSGLETVKFTGKPPKFSGETFRGYNKTVLYPYGISEWKSAIGLRYGGSFTWVCYSTGSLTDLRVNSLPKKTVYYQGEVANYSGLSLTARWSDGFSAVITPDSKMYNISFSGFSTEAPGIKTVTATLDGKSAQFKIGVHKITTFTEDQSKYPESAHNYADKLNQTKTYQCPDAIKLIVTFSDKTFVEKDVDYIYVNGTKYTADQLAGKTITISGNTLTVQLVSDSYDNYYGYSIDKIEVTKIEHTNETTTTKATTSQDGKIVTACTICGKVSKTVVIPKIASISLSSTSYTYDGKVKTPTVTVKNSKGTTLKNGTDYTVSYASGRKTPGQYAVKITFKGNYSGTKTLYFTILPGVTSSIVTTTNSSAVKLAWKAVPGATGYRVYQYDTKTKKYVTLKTTTGTSYTVSKLKSGTSYKFAVKAYSTVNGKVYWASGYKTVTATTNPGTPTLKASAGTKKATLSWNKQTGATGYVVYMATSKNGKYSKIATLKGNSSVTYTKTGLTKGKTYYFKVAAYTVANGKTLYSGYSSVKAVKIK